MLVGDFSDIFYCPSFFGRIRDGTDNLTHDHRVPHAANGLLEEGCHTQQEEKGHAKSSAAQGSQVVTSWVTSCVTRCVRNMKLAHLMKWWSCGVFTKYKKKQYTVKICQDKNNKNSYGLWAHRIQWLHKVFTGTRNRAGEIHAIGSGSPGRFKSFDGKSLGCLASSLNFNIIQNLQSFIWSLFWMTYQDLLVVSLMLVCTLLAGSCMDVHPSGCYRQHSRLWQKNRPSSSLCDLYFYQLFDMDFLI